MLYWCIGSLGLLGVFVVRCIDVSVYLVCSVYSVVWYIVVLVCWLFLAYGCSGVLDVFLLVGGFED